MNSKIIYKEKHNFFTLREYLLFAVFLFILNIKEVRFVDTLAINMFVSFFYFLLIGIISKKDVLINKNMVKRGSLKFPMRTILHLAHTGTYLYFISTKHQYVRIYDPNKHLKNLVLNNYKNLNLSNTSIKSIR